MSDVKEIWQCSARQCTEPAAFAVRWRNPAIHFNREKTWLACVGHRDFLAEFVALRDFPYRVLTMDELEREDAAHEDTESEETAR